MSRPPGAILGAHVHGAAALWILRRVEPDAADAVTFFKRNGRQDVADEISTAVAQLRTAAMLWRADEQDRVTAVGNAELPAEGDDASSTWVVDTTSVAASLLEVSERRVRQLIDDGSLVARKQGGQWLVDRLSVIRYITRQEIL